MPLFGSLRGIESARRFPCKVSLWKLFLARFVVRTSCVPPHVRCVFWCFLPPPFAVLFVVCSLLSPGPADCALSASINSQGLRPSACQITDITSLFPLPSFIDIQPFCILFTNLNDFLRPRDAFPRGPSRRKYKSQTVVSAPWNFRV